MRRHVSDEELQTSLTPYLEALELVVSATERLDPKKLPLEEAAGCLAAEDVKAPRDLPGFKNSAMDGYAVRSRDLVDASPTNPIELSVSASILAGHPAKNRLKKGQCIEIGTGAPIPRGADAVVPYENASLKDRRAVFLSPTYPGANVRPVDDVIKKGTLLVPAGTKLTPTRIGLLAQCGVNPVRVIPRPKVAILSTGDEIVKPDTPLPKGSVYDANSYLLAEICRWAGCQVVNTSVVADTKRDLTEALRKAESSADLVIISGGASVGPHDWAKEVVSNVHVWRVALKPGKPFGYAESPQGTPVILLPGNPGSAFVAFGAFGFDIVAKLGGSEPPPRMRARLTKQVTPDPKRTLVKPVKLRTKGPLAKGRAGLVVAELLVSMSSASLFQFRDVHGLALVPPGTRPHRTAEVLVFPWSTL